MSGDVTIPDEHEARRAQLNDLATVVALPATWKGLDPQQVAIGMLEVLARLLRLDAAYVRLDPPPDGCSPIAAWWPRSPEPLQALAYRLAAGAAPDWSTVETETLSSHSGGLRVAVVHDELLGADWAIAAGARRSSFPTDTERLLLSAIVEQAAIAVEATVSSRREQRHGALLRGPTEASQREITERARVERALRASEQRFRGAFAGNMVPMGIWTRSRGIADCNDALLGLVGYTRADLAAGALRLQGISPPEYRHLDEGAMAEIEALGVCSPYEKEFVRKDGSRVPVLVGGSRLDDGAQFGTFFVVDLTERKQADRASARLAAIVASSTDAIVSKTLDGVITSWNASAELMFGYTAEEIVGQSILRLIPPDRTAEEDHILARLRAGERVEHFETVRVRKDGRPIEVSLSISPVRDGNGRIIGASKIARDISERRRTDALVGGQKRVLEMLATGAALQDVLTAVVQLVEQLSDGLVAVIVVRDPESERFQVAVAPSLSDGFARMLTGGAIEAPYLDPCSLAADRGEEVRTADIVRDERWAERWRLLAAELGLCTCYASPIRGADGRLLGSFGLYYREPRDPLPSDMRLIETASYLAGIAIEQRQAEAALRRQMELHVTLNSALREAGEARDRALADAQAALRTRDEFLASISHDLRTPLATIKGLVQLVLRRAGRGPTLDSARVATSLTTVEASVNRMAAMIDELLDLTRLESGRPLDLNRRPMNLVELADQLAAEHQRGTSVHRISVEADSTSMAGDWDPVRLERVVSNLISNAVKYSPEGGTISVTVTPEERAGQAGALLTVRDEGLGIPAADLPHVFERFFRGSNVAGTIRGVGIGLAGSKQIVEQHGGTMAVNSTEGAGTAVAVWLPCEPRSARTEREA